MLRCMSQVLAQDRPNSAAHQSGHLPEGLQTTPAGSTSRSSVAVLDPEEMSSCLSSTRQRVVMFVAADGQEREDLRSIRRRFWMEEGQCVHEKFSAHARQRDSAQSASKNVSTSNSLGRGLLSRGTRGMRMEARSSSLVQIQKGSPSSIRAAITSSRSCARTALNIQLMTSGRSRKSQPKKAKPQPKGP